MGKYLKYEQKSNKQKAETNPIWRGIGCILMVLVPAMSYGFMLVLVQPILATGYIPAQLQGYVQFAPALYKWPVLGPIVSFIGSLNNLYINLIVFFLALLVLSGIFSLFYTAMYQRVGPPRYGPTDVPPSAHAGRSYKR